MSEAFNNLSPQSRLWIWVSSRPIAHEEQRDLSTALDSFLATWSSHERPVRGAWDIQDNRVLLIAGEISGGDISGCGIDKSVHLLETVASKHGFEWLPGLDVVFRRTPKSPLESLSRAAFREAAGSGRIGTEAVVVDRTIGTVGELRSGSLESAAAESWARQFFGATPQAAKT